mgnify:CR=1 FL=1|tara:strand:- start:338 stop:571 length:234 start_codon:yes stop_codon:yes gene_type:complete
MKRFSYDEIETMEKRLVNHSIKYIKQMVSEKDNEGLYDLVYKDVYNEFGTYNESDLAWAYDMAFGTDMTNSLNNEEE